TSRRSGAAATCCVTRQRKRPPPDAAGGSPRRPRSVLQLAPDGRVVGGPFSAARRLVDVAGDQPVRSLGAQHQVIDAQAHVLAPGPGLIVPERIADRVWVQGTIGVGEAEIQKLPELGPAFGPA